MAASVSRIITIPEILACAASSRLKDLYSPISRHSFTADEVLGEPITAFEARLAACDFYTYMSCFATWSYGADLDNEGGWCCDRWYLGQKIGSPEFQNASLCLLCSSPNKNSYLGYRLLKDEITSTLLKKVQNQADFSEDIARSHGLEDDYQVYWENKKFLNFLLDLFVHVGLEDCDICNVLKAGCHLAIQLAKRIGDTLQAGKSCGAPWEQKNLVKYLVNEDTGDREDSGMQLSNAATPPRCFNSLQPNCFPPILSTY